MTNQNKTNWLANGATLQEWESHVHEELQYEYFDVEEKAWHASLPRNDDVAYLREAFPGCEQEAGRSIRVLKKEVLALEEKIHQKNDLVESSDMDEISQEFWQKVVAIEHGPELLDLDKRIAVLQRYLPPTKSTQRLHDREMMVARAREHPIESATEGYMRLSRAGSSFKGLCPLHNEKTASFHIYPESNRFKCYGCGESGDVITLTMLLRNIDFNGAIAELQ